MQLWRALTAGAAAALVLISVAGCGDADLAVSAARAAEVIGDNAEDIRIPPADIAQRADEVNVSSGAWRGAFQSLAYSEVWGQAGAVIQAHLATLDEATEGPVRAAVVKSICDVLFQRNSPDLADEVSDNVRELGLPPLVELATVTPDAVQAATAGYQSIAYDKAFGSSDQRAAVSAGCFVADQEFDAAVKAASGQ